MNEHQITQVMKLLMSSVTQLCHVEVSVFRLTKHIFLTEKLSIPSKKKKKSQFLKVYTLSLSHSLDEFK